MIKRAYELLVTTLAVAAGVLTVALMVIVSADVISRSLFSQPIGWATEASEYILLHITFLAMAWLVHQRGGHVRVDLVIDALPTRIRAAMGAITALATMSACSAGAYWAGVTTIDHYQRGVLTIAIYPVPKYLLLIVIAVGFSLTMVEFLRLALAHFRTWRTGNAPPDTARRLE